MTFREDINALRALAVALVVLYHFGVGGFEGGFVGVDVFFVISGYLMTAIVAGRLARGSFGYLDFLVARALRVGPALVVLVVVLLVGGAALLPPLDLEDLARQARSALVFTSNRHFDRGQGYFQTQPDERWLLHTWSLSVEWQFYLFYPLILLGVARLAKRVPRFAAAGLSAVLCATVALLTVASCVACLVLTQTDPTSAFFSLTTRAWQLTAGGLVFFAEPWAQRRGPRARAALWLVAAVLLAAVLLRAHAAPLHDEWPGPWSLLPVLATLLVIVAGTGAPMPGATGPARRAVAALGRWSYSIYLWHWPIVVALNLLPTDATHAALATAAGIALSVALGALSYRGVERVFSRERLRAAAGPRRGVAVVAAGFALGLIGAQAAVSTDGLESRVAGDAAFFAAHQAVANERLQPRECSNHKQPVDRLKTCLLGPASDRERTLVIGDSHAQHLYAWFARHPGEGVDFFTASGCSIVRQVNRREPGHHCADYAQAAFDAARSARYRRIVIATRWKRWDDPMASQCRWAEGRCVDTDLRSVRAAALEQARGDIAELLASGREVVLVEDPPEAPFDVPRTLMRQRFLGLEIDDFIDDVPYDPDRYVERLAAGQPGLQRVSLRSLLCDAGRCRIVDATTRLPIFIDDNHLSPRWIVENGTSLRPMPTDSSPPRTPR